MLLDDIGVRFNQINECDQNHETGDEVDPLWLDFIDQHHYRETAMRIDLIITELFVGGAERCLTELAIGLCQSGDQVRVISIGSLPGGQQSLLLDRLTANGIEVKSCNADSGRHFLSAFRQLRFWLTESPPDVCQTFLFHANVLGTWAAKSAGIDHRIGGIRVVDPRRSHRQIIRWVTPSMGRVVCVSNAVERFSQQNLGCKVGQTVTIPNGVDTSRFSTATPFAWSSIGWPNDSIVTLFVGRLDQQKGIDLIQRQIEFIAPAASNRRLLLVGDGPLRKPLESWARKIGTDRVQLLSWQADVAPLMRACRLLVLPSRYEGMPNVVMEAMASGRPIVCSDVQGTEELLGHAPQCQLFPIGDSLAMKNLVDQFLNDEALSEKIGELNQRRVRNDYSITAMVDAYRSLYRSVLTNRLVGVECCE